MDRQLHLGATEQTETVADLEGPLDLVRVAVERSVDAGHDRRLPEGGLTYLAPTAGPLAVGARVEVPLGRGNTEAHGYVLEVGGRELLGTLDPRKLKRVKRAAGPVLADDLIELGTWMAGYYVTPLGMVLGSMVPGAAKKGTGSKDVKLVTRVDRAPEPEKMTKGVAAAWEAIKAMPAESFPLDPKRLASLVGAANAWPINQRLDSSLFKCVGSAHAR